MPCGCFDLIFLIAISRVVLVDLKINTALETDLKIFRSVLRAVFSNTTLETDLEIFKVSFEGGIGEFF